LQLKLEKIAVQEVMSTPLFLLSPEDSLLTAHQEMQRRRVRRLVVSWNWGRGLGIVTQTNLLRIFDPIEMYGVIETLQHTVQQLEQEKAELLEIVEQKIEVI
jgi:signal-transduction protein with cAMP-binding, CBS, and nucleotidyltransferase domain